jgi:hypothetical protein
MTSPVRAERPDEPDVRADLQGTAIDTDRTTGGRADCVAARSPSNRAPAQFLTAEELVEKTKLVEIIDRTMSSFIECGAALARVRDEHLYRDEHATFEAFVEARWSLTARRARQLMAAAEIATALPRGTAVPLVERHVRELMPLRDRPELMAEALQIAELDERGVTSDSVKAGVDYVVNRTNFIDTVLTVESPLKDVLDPVTLTSVVATEWAARTYFLERKLMPQPAAFQWCSCDRPECPDFVIAGAGRDDPAAAWRTAVLREAAEFDVWWRLVGFASPHDAPFTDIEEDEHWNDAALERWIDDPDFTVEDRRAAAIGHAFCWVSPKAGISGLGSWLRRSGRAADDLAVQR